MLYILLITKHEFLFFYMVTKHRGEKKRYKTTYLPRFCNINVYSHVGKKPVAAGEPTPQGRRFRSPRNKKTTDQTDGRTLATNRPKSATRVVHYEVVLASNRRRKSPKLKRARLLRWPG